jgi:hypothetical protein
MTFTALPVSPTSGRKIRFFVLASALLALPVLLWPRAASAQSRREFIDGQLVGTPGTDCITGARVTQVGSFASYFGARDLSFPRVGDVSYVRAFSQVVGNPCSGGDVIGFDFFLPPGATLAISADNPVICQAQFGSNPPIENDPAIRCNQTPSSGAFGGLFFGFAEVPKGFSFQIMVPVRFNQSLRPGTLGVAVSTVGGRTDVRASVNVP